MQTINLEAIELLSLKQIEASLIEVADTVMHCADNQIPVNEVIRMVRSSLHAQMEGVLRASVRELERKRASLPVPAGVNPHTAIPPWMVADREKQHANYQTKNA